MYIVIFLFLFFITDVATRAFNGTEKEVTDCIARTIKYAPDRLGRGGRKK